MEPKNAIAAFAALAQETRLAVLQHLVKAGPAGVPAGTLATFVGASPSTLSFHLAQLERAGLVTSRRDQRWIFYSANFDGLRDLVQFMTDDCCDGHPEICDVREAAKGLDRPAVDYSKPEVVTS